MPTPTYTLKATHSETGNVLETRYATTDTERDDKLDELERYYRHDCIITVTTPEHRQGNPGMNTSTDPQQPTTEPLEPGQWWCYPETAHLHLVDHDALNGTAARLVKADGTLITGTLARNYNYGSANEAEGWDVVGEYSTAHDGIVSDAWYGRNGWTLHIAGGQPPALATANTLAHGTKFIACTPEDATTCYAQLISTPGEAPYVLGSDDEDGDTYRMGDPERVYVIQELPTQPAPERGKITNSTLHLHSH